MRGDDQALEPQHTSDVIKQLNAAAKAALDGVGASLVDSKKSSPQQLLTHKHPEERAT